jgi:hypothetical protein
MPSPTSSNSYQCDTLPAPRLASPKAPVHLQSSRSPSPPLPFSLSSSTISSLMDNTSSQKKHVSQAIQSSAPAHPAPRKLCVRHQRMADEGTNLKLQQVSHFPSRNTPKIMLVFSIIGPRCPPRRGTTSRQFNLVQLLLFVPPKERARPPGHTHHVLLLPIIPSHRTTWSPHPHRPLHCPSS